MFSPLVPGDPLPVIIARINDLARYLGLETGQVVPHALNTLDVMRLLGASTTTVARSDAILVPERDDDGFCAVCGCVTTHDSECPTLLRRHGQSTPTRLALNYAARKQQEATARRDAGEVSD